MFERNMKSVLLFGVVTCATIVFAGADEELSNLSSWGCMTKNCEITNRVNFLKIKTVKVNEKYFVNQCYKVDVQKINNTYNRMDAYFEIANDIPEDTEFTAQILSSNSSHGNYKTIREYNFFLCRNSSNVKYLNYLGDSVAEAIKAEKCLKKGMLHYGGDLGLYFRFRDLLSAEDYKSSFFKSINTLKCGNEVIFSAEITIKNNCN